MMSPRWKLFHCTPSRRLVALLALMPSFLPWFLIPSLPSLLLAAPTVCALASHPISVAILLIFFYLFLACQHAESQV